MISTYFTAQSRYIFLNLQSNTSCCQIPRHNHLQMSRMGALLPGLLQACGKPTTTIWKTVNSLQKPQSKHKTRLLLVQRCKYRPCYRHRTGSCNFNQSRTEALPVARSRAAREGREGAPRSSAPVDWFTIAHFREQMVPITRSRRIWETVREVTILAGVLIAQNRFDFGPFAIEPKSSATIPKVLGNPLAST